MLLRCCAAAPRTISEANRSCQSRLAKAQMNHAQTRSDAACNNNSLQPNRECIRYHTYLKIVCPRPAELPMRSTLTGKWKGPSTSMAIRLLCGVGT